jgi:hypothetical protein
MMQSSGKIIEKNCVKFTQFEIVKKLNKVIFPF